MGAKQGLVALGFTVAAGIGVATAVHEVPQFNSETTQVEACLPVKNTAGEWVDSRFAETDFCRQAPRTAAEVNTLRDAADTYGSLGWLGVAGVAAGTLSIVMWTEDEDPAERKIITIRRPDDQPPAGPPTPDQEPDNRPPEGPVNPNQEAATPPPVADPSISLG